MTLNPLEKRRVALEEEYFARENIKKLAAIRDGLIGRPSPSESASEDCAGRKAAAEEPRRDVCDAA
jgi:hypothetical protein